MKLFKKLIISIGLGFTLASTALVSYMFYMINYEGGVTFIEPNFLIAHTEFVFSTFSAVFIGYLVLKWMQKGKLEPFF